MNSPNDLRRLPKRFKPVLQSVHAFSEVSKGQIRALLGQCLQLDHHDHQALDRIWRVVLKLGKSGLKFAFNLVIGTFSHEIIPLKGLENSAQMGALIIDQGCYGGLVSHEFKGVLVLHLVRGATAIFTCPEAGG